MIDRDGTRKLANAYKLFDLQDAYSLLVVMGILSAQPLHVFDTQTLERHIKVTSFAVEV